jgi:uncharacterized protein (TIGR03435 family)
MVIIHRIQRTRRLRRLTTIAIFLLGVVPAFAQMAGPEFEVASVKRNLSGTRPWLVPPVAGRFTVTNVTLKQLIAFSWPRPVSESSLRVSGGPSWVASDGYDVSAIALEPDVSREVFSLMMQNLLEERFALRVHTEMHDAQVYALVAAKRGMNLPDARPEPCIYGWKGDDLDPKTGCGAMGVTPESITDEKVSMQWFAGVLGGLLGRPVVNKTGFGGSFKVNLEFAPVVPGSGTDVTKASIFTVLEEQLGLRLQPQKGTEEVLVIDNAERPSPN